jgi:hypothetical protein
MPLPLTRDLFSWNVFLTIEDMCMMFQGASIFNQNLSVWSVSNVHFMSKMCLNATSLDQDIAFCGIPGILPNFCKTPTLKRIGKQLNSIKGTSIKFKQCQPLVIPKEQLV